jgi:hypothetical protein
VTHVGGGTGSRTIAAFSNPKLHGALFDQPTASRWLEFFRPMLLTAAVGHDG